MSGIHLVYGYIHGCCVDCTCGSLEAATTILVLMMMKMMMMVAIVVMWMTMMIMILGNMRRLSTRSLYDEYILWFMWLVAWISLYCGGISCAYRLGRWCARVTSEMREQQRVMIKMSLLLWRCVVARLSRKRNDKICSHGTIFIRQTPSTHHRQTVKTERELRDAKSDEARHSEHSTVRQKSVNMTHQGTTINTSKSVNRKYNSRTARKLPEPAAATKTTTRRT